MSQQRVQGQETFLRGPKSPGPGVVAAAAQMELAWIGQPVTRLQRGGITMEGPEGSTRHRASQYNPGWPKRVRDCGLQRLNCDPPLKIMYERRPSGHPTAMTGLQRVTGVCECEKRWVVGCGLQRLGVSVGIGEETVEVRTCSGY